MAPTQPGLSIVIPIYNEKQALEHTLREFEKILGGLDFPAELILVDDGSGDGSGEFLEEVRHPAIRVHHHRSNLGYGAALKSGIRRAKYDYVGITDADGTYPHRRLPEFYRLAVDGNADMIVGARTGKDAQIPWVRRFPKWCLGRLAGYVSQQRIPDLNSGLRVMHKKILERYFPILPDGFSFTTTITLAMLVNNHAIRYETIEYHRRMGRSKIRPIHDTLNFIGLILRTSIFFGPLRVFTLLGLVMWVFAIFTIILGITVLDQIPDVTIAILVLGGIQIMCLGLVADLINRKFPSRE